MQIDFGTLPNFPAPITLQGNFVFTNYCCCSSDGATFAGSVAGQEVRVPYTAEYYFYRPR